MKIVKLTLASFLATTSFATLALAKDQKELLKEASLLRAYYSRKASLEDFKSNSELKKLKEEVSGQASAIKKFSSEFLAKVKKESETTSKAVEELKELKETLGYVLTKEEPEEKEDIIKAVEKFIKSTSQEGEDALFARDDSLSYYKDQIKGIKNRMAKYEPTAVKAYDELAKETYGATAVKLIEAYKVAAKKTDKKNFELIEEVAKYHAADDKDALGETVYSSKTVLSKLEEATTSYSKAIETIKGLSDLQYSKKVTPALKTRIKTVVDQFISRLANEAALEKGISEIEAKLGIKEALKEESKKEEKKETSGKASVKTSSSSELFTLLSLAVSAVVVRKKR